MMNTEKLKWIEGFDLKKCKEELRYYRQAFYDMTISGRYDTSHCIETIQMLEDRINKISKCEEK